jgi:hypothetical protein
MIFAKKYWVLAAALGAMFVSGVAVGQTIDRYAEATATITKAQALLNAITITNNAEKKQHDKAAASLSHAQQYIACAQLKVENPKAVCQ